MRITEREIRDLIREALAGTSASDFLKTNKQRIKKATGADISGADPELIHFLSKFEISKTLGSGEYGRVFSFSNSPLVLKIFMSSTEDGSDILRMKRLLKKSGTSGSSGEMYYFGVGRAGQGYLWPGMPTYYAIMPKIVPFTTTETFKKNKEFFFKLQLFFAQSVAGKENKVSAEDFASFVRDWDQLDIDIGFSRGKMSLEEKQREEGLIPANVQRFEKMFRRNESTAEKIAQARARAKALAGEDLSLNNLGYFEQSPETLFFFDM